VDEKNYQCLEDVRLPLLMRSGDIKNWIRNMSEKAPVVFLFLQNRLQDAAMVILENTAQQWTGQKKSNIF